MNKIGLLATGDEIINGDIINSNGKYIAEQLVTNGLTVGSHVMVSDHQSDIESALQFLLEDHEIIIILGGLGPTSDDRTRYAASKVLDKPLIFHQENWQTIKNYLKALSLIPHEANRQQALYPQGAELISNPAGTAAGFFVSHSSKLLFFLPGPPLECLTMFDNTVLPYLLTKLGQEKQFHKRWRLFGVSEGEIAAKLDEALNKYSLQTGYRVDYPYLEFKIRAMDIAILDTATNLIEDLLNPYLLNSQQQKASDYLREQIQKFNQRLIIEDTVTGGLLQTILLTPHTKHTVDFKKVPELLNANEIGVVIHGLNEYWENKIPAAESKISITFITKNQQLINEYTIPYRHNRIVFYAVEFIANKISLYMDSYQLNL